MLLSYIAKGMFLPWLHLPPNMQTHESTSRLTFKPRGQTIAETLEEHDRNLSKMPASYRRMVRMARQEAEAEDDPDSIIKRGGFRPVYPGDEPSETDSKHDQEA